MSSRWTAARFGTSQFLRGAVHGGLRQRVGHGSWTTRIDGWAGMAMRETLTADPADPLQLTTTVDLVPTVGGTVRMRSIGFELGFGLTEPVGRAAVVLRLPGVVSVF